MLLVVDANILVAASLRVKGREALQDKRLHLFMAEVAWHEATYALERRSRLIVEQKSLSPNALQALLTHALDTAQAVVTIVPEPVYLAFYEEARLRIPRDPDDWHTVALALLLDAAIWTQDNWTQDKDFLGCGVATWSTDTLMSYLETYATE